jgi:hypothetical protein
VGAPASWPGALLLSAPGAGAGWLLLVLLLAPASPPLAALPLAALLLLLLLLLLPSLLVLLPSLLVLLALLLTMPSILALSSALALAFSPSTRTMSVSSGPSRTLLTDRASLGSTLHDRHGAARWGRVADG